MSAKFAIIEQTTPHLSFAQDVELYRSVGAAGIGIVERKVTDDESCRGLLSLSGLAVSSFLASCNSLFASFRSPAPAEPSARLDAIGHALRRAAPFAPEVFLVSSGPLGQQTESAARERLVSGLRALAGQAAELGMKLGFELMHPSVRDLFGFVTSLQAGLELVDAVGAANFGLVVDLWHTGDAPAIGAGLCSNAQQILAVHLNNRPATPRSWCDRLLPGDGAIEVGALLAQLDQGGFQGWYELEVMSDDGSVERELEGSLWRWPPDQLVRTGREQFMDLLPGHDRNP